MSEKTYDVYEPEAGNDLLAALRRSKNVSVLYAAAYDAAIKIEEQAAKIERLLAVCMPFVRIADMIDALPASDAQDNGVPLRLVIPGLWPSVGDARKLRDLVKPLLTHEQSVGKDSDEMSKRPGDPGYAGGWCIHYRYNRNVKLGEPNTCEAGVDYAAWDGMKFAGQPCFLDNGQSRSGAAHCSSLRRPTTEEMAAHEKWVEERMMLMGTVMVGIAPWRAKHKGHSAAEVVECPACKGRLHLSIAAYNGHVHGKCETENCVSWME